jgi:hypothetical protein
MDSAYWKEWNLFNLGGGIDLFLALHFPIIAIHSMDLLSCRREHRKLLEYH